MTRRIVRTTPDFEAMVDAQLGEERGPNGEPSSADFLEYEIDAVKAAFAERWDNLPMLIDGRPEYRVYVYSGYLIPMISVTGQYAPDGRIELTEVWIDLQPPTD